MCSLDRKFHKLIEEFGREDKERCWQRLVREHFGCQLCQHYDCKKESCKIGHQDILEERHGVPCDDILPTELGKKKKGKRKNKDHI